MKFTAIFRHKGTDEDGWPETYNKPGVKTIEDAEVYCKEVLEQFNSTLKRGELPRELVTVEAVEPPAPVDDGLPTEARAISTEELAMVKVIDWLEESGLYLYYEPGNSQWEIKTFDNAVVTYGEDFVELWECIQNNTSPDLMEEDDNEDLEDDDAEDDDDSDLG